MTQESTVAIITARGGSKRIPRKNVRNFCGRPIIEYSIEAAIKSGIFDEVMVSTDDNEIAEIAKRAGASVPFMRSAATSGDFATTAEVLFEVFDWYKKQGRNFGYACCIYPTAPFVTAAKLRIGIRLLMEKDGGILMPVVRYSYPPQRSMVKQGDFLISKYPEYYDSRSQDLEVFYHDCGQFYFYNIEKFYGCEGRFKEEIIPLEVPELEVQDIDNEADWKLAEMKYQLMLDNPLA